MRYAYTFGAVLLVGAAAAFALRSNPPDKHPRSDLPAMEDASKSMSRAPSAAGQEAVSTSESTMDSSVAKVPEAKPFPPETDEERRIRARSRAVAADSTPQTAAIAQAQIAGGQPARVTSLAMPDAFDARAWGRDPDYRKSYMAAAEPGRVWQTAPPADDGVALRASGPRQRSAKQGEPVELSVVCRPGAPASFTSFTGGVFRESETNAVTVAADANGTATVHFVAYAGTTDHCAILAASPTAIGQVTFDVLIESGAP